MLVAMSLPANPVETSGYLEPEIEDYGDLAELTAGLSSGSRTDALFPIHPRRDWTFSTP
jgi:hypothetical protein